MAAGRAGVNHPDAQVDTNTNVSGVIINLVERTAKLISPSSDLDRWPLGYAVFANGHFRDGESLAELLGSWEHDVMAEAFSDGFVPVLRKDLSLSATDREEPVRLASGFTELSVSDPVGRAILARVDGRRSVAQIVRLLLADHDPWMLYSRFRQLYQCGLFAEAFPHEPWTPPVTLAYEHPRAGGTGPTTNRR